MSYYFGRRRWTSWYGDPAARGRRNQMRFALRSLAWMANFIVASMSLRNEWVLSTRVVRTHPRQSGGWAAHPPMPTRSPDPVRGA